MLYARDLRETRIYINTILEHNNKNPTTHRTARILRLLHCIKVYQQ